MAPALGSSITIEATVLHTVDLGGGETNYCLELPSGHTAWLLGSQLGIDQDAEVRAQAETEAPDTKVVPGPPATKTTRKPRRAPAA